MTEERRKILEMLAERKITVADAERLLAAVDEPDRAESESLPAGKTSCKYLRIQVDPAPGSESRDKVNIRVPMKLIRAGLKFAAFIPQGAHGKVNAALKEKGLDVDLAKITPQDLEDIVSNLDDMTVEVEGKDKVRIFCE
jgi:hypothetical protein